MKNYKKKTRGLVLSIQFPNGILNFKSLWRMEGCLLGFSQRFDEFFLPLVLALFREMTSTALSAVGNPK